MIVPSRGYAWVKTVAPIRILRPVVVAFYRPLLQESGDDDDIELVVATGCNAGFFHAAENLVAGLQHWGAARVDGVSEWVSEGVGANHITPPRGKGGWTPSSPRDTLATLVIVGLMERMGPIGQMGP